MADIKQVRHQFLIVLTVLLVICVVCTAVLISPIGTSVRKSQQQVDALWAELRVREREVVPLRGIDKKVVLAKEEIADFYRGRFPSSYAAVSEQLGKLAASTGVKLAGGRYQAEATDVPGLQRIRIDASIGGNYLQLVKFINAVERDKTFFLIDGVALGEQQGGAVRLQIRMETYLRGS